MKKYLLLLLSAIVMPHFVYSQQEAVPEFNREYFRCENKWVLLPKKANDSTYSYGFIYLDRAAGFTYDHGGSIQISTKGEYIAKPFANTSVKHRLEPNTVLMALLPADRIKEIGLPAEPEWLAIYREGENEIDQLVRRGYIFNHVGGSDLAIPLLEKAYGTEPHAPGLEFELSYAYNATDQPEKAIEVVEKGLKNNPKDYMLFRELGYAYIQLNKIKEAEETYTKGIAIATNKVQQAEMAFNMAGIYYRAGNSKKFKEWAAAVRKYAEEDSVYYKNLLMLENELNKK